MTTERRFSSVEPHSRRYYKSVGTGWILGLMLLSAVVWVPTHASNMIIGPLAGDLVVERKTPWTITSSRSNNLYAFVLPRIRGGSDTAKTEDTVAVDKETNSTSAEEGGDAENVVTSNEEEVVKVDEATIVESSEETIVVEEEVETKEFVPEENEPVQVVVSTDDNPYYFSGCKHGDGSESDPDGIPRRFLKMQKQNRERAKHALEVTMAWRAEHDVDTILATPHPLFDICKAVVPHYFGGRDPTNHVIFIQRPGLLNLKMAHANNLTMEELLMHYVYVLEYCWNVEEPRHDQTMTSVIDLTGINLGTLTRGEMLGFVKRFISMMSSHYPSRSYKTLLLNTPRWFGAIYKLISPLLRESTKKKIEIHSRGKRQDKALKKYLGDDRVPEELLSKKKETPKEASVESIAGIGRESDMERDLRAFCVARLDEAGVDMNPIIV